MNASSLIQVSVSGVSEFREIIGKDTMIVVGRRSTLRDLISKLEEQFGSAYERKVGENLDYSLRSRFNLLYNGKFLSLKQNLDMTLSDGDQILFFQLTGA